VSDETTTTLPSDALFTGVAYAVSYISQEEQGTVLA
jgi:hypothetical protein